MLFKNIGSNTHEVRTYLNAHPGELSSATLERYERSLAREARELGRAVRNPNAGAKSSS